MTHAEPGTAAFRRTPFLRTWSALALPRRTRLRWAWAAAMPALWALGWTVTTLGGISVREQFTIFGAYGALTFAALSGLLLHQMLPYRAAVEHRPAPRPASP